MTTTKELAEALRQLVGLKDMKDRLKRLHAMGHGTDYTDYYRLQPIAWEAARTALASHDAAQSDPPKKGEAEKWPKWWRLEGFNGAITSAERALKHLSSNPKPAGGEQLFNTAHLLQIAHELELTRKHLLCADAAQSAGEAPVPPCAWCVGTGRFADHACRFCAGRGNGSVFAAAPPSPAVERDAARYRWLRDDEEWAFFDSGWLVKHDLYGQGSDSLDAFIDAAMVAARAALEGEKP